MCRAESGFDYKFSLSYILRAVGAYVIPPNTASLWTNISDQCQSFKHISFWAFSRSINNIIKASVSPTSFKIAKYKQSQTSCKVSQELIIQAEVTTYLHAGLWCIVRMSIASAGTVILSHKTSLNMTWKRDWQPSWLCPVVTIRWHLKTLPSEDVKSEKAHQPCHILAYLFVHSKGCGSMRCQTEVQINTVKKGETDLKQLAIWALHILGFHTSIIMLRMLSRTAHLFSLML